MAPNASKSMSGRGLPALHACRLIPQHQLKLLELSSATHPSQSLDSRPMKSSLLRRAASGLM